ncbi:MAG: type IV secretory system conjugative DNA transfer family protein [Collinsella sp.]|nr:type IV secretory system conjugative DNA transfer family protein [Collinsella sp.]
MPSPTPAIDRRISYRGETILGAGRMLETDSHRTGLNNNMLVIGLSGAGKTRDVLIPNLLQMTSSYIVVDTKGTLCGSVGPVLAAHGYEVERIDFTDLASGGSAGCAIASVGYDPLRFIRCPRTRGRTAPSQQDILSVARALCPVENERDPFWDHAAANLMACLIAYVMEVLPERERSFAAVVSLAEGLGTGEAFNRLQMHAEADEGTLAASLYRRYAGTVVAEKMNASIIGVLSEKMAVLGFDGANRLYRCPRQVDLASFGTRKRALFVTVSDIDRALDPLVSLFLSQALTALMRAADSAPSGALAVPVRFLLDDFANLRMPRIDEILAVVRSREIWCTLLLQSVSQLEALYGRPRAMSIMGNCDTHLVLGFQDLDTAHAFSERADRMPTSLLLTPFDRAWLFIRGRRAEEVARFQLEDHPRYGEFQNPPTPPASRWPAGCGYPPMEFEAAVADGFDLEGEIPY